MAKLKLTTVLTLLSRLADKGFVEVYKDGRINCYRPLVEEETYKQQAAVAFLATVYHNDSRQLLNALWSGGSLSADEVNELLAMIEATKKDDKHNGG